MRAQPKGDPETLMWDGHAAMEAARQAARLAVKMKSGTGLTSAIRNTKDAAPTQKSCVFGARTVVRLTADIPNHVVNGQVR